MDRHGSTSMAAHPPQHHVSSSTGPVATPYHHSDSPFRYINLDTEHTSGHNLDMGDARTHRQPFHRETSEIAPRSLTISPGPTHAPTRGAPTGQSSYTPRHSFSPAPVHTVVQQFTYPAPSYSTNRRGLRIMNLIKPFLPILLYGMSSIGFVIAIAFWKSEVFHGLDDLSHWIRDEAPLGYVILFCMIVITTIRESDLLYHSTAHFIILSGYTFGALTGAIISYFAALTGAIVVFLASRYFFQESITKWLTQAATIKRVVRAIEKRPTLLFLIRLAPYPYNVMNCLLAASPTLTFKTYTVCTALSLFKVIIHTSIGSSIHSFADYHLKTPEDGADADSAEDDQGHTLKQAFMIGGIVLCVAILVYLSYVARKAVDEELDDEAMPSSHSEENVAFLAEEDDGGMIESSLHGFQAASADGQSDRRAAYAV